ncbi:hypothetical protein DICPUDRAFT_22083, partial [Dictyostelium purpureum]
KMNCPHKKMDVTDISLYSYPEFFDDERFPLLAGSHCNATCKEKMMVYFKVYLELRYKWTMHYIEDARVVEDLKVKEVDEFHYPSLEDYYGFFENRSMGEDPDSEATILKYSKVGILDGKPVRLCDLPGGTKCDFDATNLEE